MSKEIQFYYEKAKGHLLYMFVLFALVGLFFKLLVPQFESTLQNRVALSETREKLKNLENKRKVLERLDRVVVSERLTRLNQALPSEKDIGGFLTVLENVSARSGVRLGSLSVLVGPIATPSSEQSKIGVPHLPINVNLVGDVLGVKDFVREMRKSLPVVSIEKVSFAEGSGIVGLSFFFKPFQVSYQRDAPLPVLTKGYETVLEEVLKREVLNAPVAPPIEGGSRQNPFR